MEAAKVLSAGLPLVGELWGMSVKGVPMPVESLAWMDEDGVPVVRLFVASAATSGDEVTISFCGATRMVVPMKVSIDKPFAVTIRYVESAAA